MWRNFTARGKYIYVLDKIVNVYNNSFHRTIKMRPVDVNKSNENQIFNSVFSNTELKINDTVRISKYKTVFSKGYTPNWSEELFIITDLIARKI